MGEAVQEGTAHGERDSVTGHAGCVTSFPSQYRGPRLEHDGDVLTHRQRQVLSEEVGRMTRKGISKDSAGDPRLRTVVMGGTKRGG